MVRNPLARIPESHWLRARELRRTSTVAEKKLWHGLRNYALDVKFRRQHPIGPYIVDFCSPEIRLVIEVDGDVHAAPEAQEYDHAREHYLNAHGFIIKRYANRAILENIAAVFDELNEVIRTQIVRLHPDPPFVPPFARGED